MSLNARLLLIRQEQARLLSIRLMKSLVVHSLD
jgi:hypothetical protein